GAGRHNTCVRLGYRELRQTAEDQDDNAASSPPSQKCAVVRVRIVERHRRRRVCEKAAESCGGRAVQGRARIIDAIEKKADKCSAPSDNIASFKGDSITDSVADFTDTAPSNSTNFSRSTIFGYKSQYTTVEAVVTGLILSLVIVITIVGNILVCLAVFLVRKLRRPCNYLLVSLAVSDLCVAILVMPMALLYEILGRWSFGNFMCDLWVSFDVLSCAASILNLCMISVDRYYAITKPLEYGVKRTPKRMILCVSLVWLGAACISLPPLLIIGNEHEVIEGVPHCVVCQNFGYQIYATLGSFYIPLTVMIIVYYKIFCAARRIVLEERRAQSHLETNHCYLEISVKNGDGPPESRLATSYESSPAISTPAAANRTSSHHRTSNTSIATVSVFFTHKYFPSVFSLYDCVFQPFSFRIVYSSSILIDAT
ncbi:5-hydroxytryptamine receptor 7, partial [Sarracenia purpurea var. burkii]